MIIKEYINFGEDILIISKGSRLLDIDYQISYDKDIQVFMFYAWFDRNEEEVHAVDKYHILILSTGSKKDIKDYEFLKTVHMREDRTVWHIFYKKS